MGGAEESACNIDPVSCVDIPSRCAALRAPEELAIGAGRSALAPDPREWRAVVRVDKDCQGSAVTVVADNRLCSTISAIADEVIEDRDLRCGERDCRAGLGGRSCHHGRQPYPGVSL